MEQSAPKHARVSPLMTQLMDAFWSTSILQVINHRTVCPLTFWFLHFGLKIAFLSIAGGKLKTNVQSPHVTSFTIYPRSNSLSNDVSSKKFISYAAYTLLRRTICASDVEQLVGPRFHINMGELVVGVGLIDVPLTPSWLSIIKMSEISLAKKSFYLYLCIGLTNSWQAIFA